MRPLVLTGAIIAALPFLHPLTAANAREQGSFLLAQQDAGQHPAGEKDKQERPNRSKKPPAAKTREERGQQAQEQRQQRREQAQDRRQERRERAQDRRNEKREQAEDRRQQKREQAQDRRQENREQVQERRQQNRERVEDRREQAKEQRQGKREDRQDARRARRLDDIKRERKETREGNRVVIREPGRTIITENGRTIIRHDDVDRLRGRSQNVHVEHRGGQTVTVIDRPGGIKIVSVIDAQGRLVRRVRRDVHGREVVIIDNRPRGPAGFFVQVAPPVIHIPRARYVVEAEAAAPALIFQTLMAPPVEPLAQRYSLDQIRYTYNLRARMPRVDLDTITFETGSWEVTPAEAARLAPIAQAVRQAVAKNPNEVFMVEGHTDAVGDEVDNLSLSDRRAEAVAEILSEQFGVPPENLVTQGYGEQYLKINVQGPERRNRRVTIRRITPLLAQGA